MNESSFFCAIFSEKYETKLCLPLTLHASRAILALEKFIINEGNSILLNYD